ncbi:MAG: hypothetical protein GC162_03980 [Planctomycetes bacterium]|nr:hypothetical protein [Planctomycetota bacterium]
MDSAALHHMSVEQKLDLMEALWADLSRDPATVDSPEWHAGVLRERQSQIDRGDAKLSDWEDARRRLRQTRSK